MTSPHPWPAPNDCSTAHLQELIDCANVPGRWLREAVRMATALESAPLLRRLAQHPNLPEDVLPQIVRNLPWPSLVELCQSPAANQELRTACQNQLLWTWPRLDPASRLQWVRAVPEPLWDHIWLTAELPALGQFLARPDLRPMDLVKRIQAPLSRDQAEALRNSPFLTDKEVIFRVLVAMADSFRAPATELVLGLSAAWIKALTPEERLQIASTLSYPPLQRLAEVWASRLSPPA